MLSGLLLLLGTATRTAATASMAWTAPEPFSPITGADPTGLSARPDADDPLVRYTWASGTNASALQLYRVSRADAATATPESAFSGVPSLTDGGGRGPSGVYVTVHGPGALRLDFGVERAAWFEFESADLGTQAGAVSASISEFNSPYPGKTMPLKAYGSTYRLETNTELYEGVRFAWIFFKPTSPDAAVARPWHITNISLVAKIKPVQYTGSFASKDDVLTKVWYSGACGAGLQNFGAESVFRPRKKHELVLSILKNGVWGYCAFSAKTKHPVLTRPISNPQNPFSAPKF